MAAELGFPQSRYCEYSNGSAYLDIITRRAIVNFKDPESSTRQSPSHSTRNRLPAVMLTEREQQISPIVQESVVHNTKTLTTLHNLTASLFGIGAGILGLESYPGFLFYLVFSLLTSALVYVLRVRPGLIKDSGSSNAGMGRYFRGSMELWTGGLVEGLSGFVLTWTLFYGLVRA